MPASQLRLTLLVLPGSAARTAPRGVVHGRCGQAAPAPASQSAGLAANINLTLIASGLTRPVMPQPRREHDRIFIVESGRRRIYKNGSLLPTSFLDVSALVSYGNEQGLLSVAFHPNYANNGYFYVYYTNLSGNLQIMRYSVSANPDVADPTSKPQTVIIIAHPTNTNHNGGQLQFGPRTAISISALGMAAAAAIRPTMRKTRAFSWARCCAWM